MCEHAGIWGVGGEEVNGRVGCGGSVLLPARLAYVLCHDNACSAAFPWAASCEKLHFFHGWHPEIVRDSCQYVCVEGWKGSGEGNAAVTTRVTVQGQ
eukprot:366086-Chlamydomonas_euryale.AAC.18